MTKLLDDAVAARRLPPERQDEIAASILDVVEHDGTAEDIELAHLTAIEEGLEQVERGEFADEEEVAAAFARFRS